MLSSNSSQLRKYFLNDDRKVNHIILLVTISQAYNTNTPQLAVHNLWEKKKKKLSLLSIYFPSKKTYAS